MSSNLGYQGDVVDPSTGLVDMQARMYVGVLGRFATQDSVFGSLQAPTSLDQFIYGTDNPVTNTDPSGHCPNPAVCPPPPNYNRKQRNRWLRIGQRFNDNAWYNHVYGPIDWFPPPVVPKPKPSDILKWRGVTTGPSGSRIEHGGMEGFIAAASAAALDLGTLLTGDDAGLESPGSFTMNTTGTEIYNPKTQLYTISLIMRINSSGLSQGAGFPSQGPEISARSAIGAELGTGAARASYVVNRVGDVSTYTLTVQNPRIIGFVPSIHVALAAGGTPGGPAMLTTYASQTVWFPQCPTPPTYYP